MAASTGVAWTDAMVAASIVLSATTYLFDFGSNLVVLMQYSTRYLHFLHREERGVSSCDAECRHQTSDLAGYFYALLAIMASCHSLNAILFKLKFTHKEAPLCAAYFLPLIHLYRLSHLLWRTLSCKGIRDLRSPEMNGLYCILGSSMEGVPMLILQFCAYLVLTKEHGLAHSMSITFKVSVAASLVSAAYNGGTSVQSIAKNATSLKQKLGAVAIGASFTLTATLARCLTFTYIIVYIRQYFSRQRTVREQAKFHVSDSVPLLVISGSIVAYLLYFWLLHSPRAIFRSLRSHHRLLTALAFSYMSMNLGPLYALISQANDANQLGSYTFRLKLFTLCLLHLLLDLAALSVTKMLGTLPSLYIIISSVTAVGYLLSLIAYIKFDASCGPQRISDLATIPVTHATEHKLVSLRELFRLADIVDAQHAQLEYKKLKPHDAASQQVYVEPPSDHTDFSTSEKAEAILGCNRLETLIGSSKKDMQSIRLHIEVPEAKGATPLLTSCSLSLNNCTSRGNTRLIKCATWPHFVKNPFKAT